MRSALAKGLGVEADKIEIDYAKKTATIEIGDASPDAVALAAAMKETNQYTASIVE